jgi:hypothetical protein
MSKMIQLTDHDMAEVTRLSALGSMSSTDIAAQRRRSMRRQGLKTKADQYEEYAATVDAVRRSGDPRAIRAWGTANLALKDIPPGEVHVDATLSNMSVQYANEMYIGEELMPVLQVFKETDVYFSYGQSDRLQYPDDEMGSRGQANEIQETRGTTTYVCRPFGFSNFVSRRTLTNEDAPLDEMVDLVEAIAEGLAFRREQRIAGVMNTAANYGTNTAAIAAANRWDTVTGGDPIADIQNATAAIWQGRGPSELVAFCSLDVYQVLSRHPAILDLFKYNGSSPGLATPDMIARFFDIERLYVGKARQDAAVNEALPPNYTRIWGDNFGVCRVSRRASIRNAVFGYTFRHGAIQTVVDYDPLKGHGGGYTAQVSASETHDVVASPTGFLITTPVGP